MNRQIRLRLHGKPRRGRRRGLTLLEIMLSLIILGGALVAVGELIRTASRSARDARDWTAAQVLAESLLAEITTGIVPAEPVERQPDPYDPDWVYSILVDSPNQDGLLQVTIIIERADVQLTGARSQPFQLVRWMLDPQLDLAPPAGDASSSGSSGSSSSSGSSGSPGTAGSSGTAGGGF